MSVEWYSGRWANLLKGCFVAARLRSVADSKSQKDGEGRVVEGCIVVQHKM